MLGILGLPLFQIPFGDDVEEGILLSALLPPPTAPPPNPTIYTLNPHSDFSLSYLGGGWVGVERREKALHELGLKIVRFRNDEVVKDLSAVVEKIRKQLS